MKIYIPHNFDNWNTYIYKERTNKFRGSSLKKKETQIVAKHCKGIKYDSDYPIKVIVTKYFKDKRQDLDNVRIKGILDGLVKCGVLKNDNLNCIVEIELKAKFDKNKIGIELELLPYETIN